MEKNQTFSTDICKCVNVVNIKWNSINKCFSASAMFQPNVGEIKSEEGVDDLLFSTSQLIGNNTFVIPIKDTLVREAANNVVLIKQLFNITDETAAETKRQAVLTIVNNCKEEKALEANQNALLSLLCEVYVGKKAKIDHKLFTVSELTDGKYKNYVLDGYGNGKPIDTRNVCALHGGFADALERAKANILRVIESEGEAV